MGGNFLKQMNKSAKSTGKWMGNAAKDSGNWIKNAGEDVFQTGGKVGNRILDFGDAQISKVTDIFSSPTFLIVAGVVIVAIIILK